MSEQNSGIQQPQVSIEKELRKSYLEYSLSVIIGRAIPDARDGLKPVHRRIMYAQYGAGQQLQPSAQEVGAHRRRRHR